MHKTRLNLALFSALTVLGASQAMAAPSVNSHGVVVLDENKYTNFGNYLNQSVTRLFVHYNEGALI